MQFKGLVALFALALVCMLAATPLAAQETRGAIEGTITDASGAVLPGVTVEARGASGGLFTSTTDARGAYRFPSLAPGSYVVTATLQGFTPGTRTVNLDVGQLLKVDVPLAIAGLSETVQVSGEAPTIDVKQTTAATNIQAAEIDRL
ncbi:MAG TPA: carboxypeptidase-like regulatory domain-containing protein, partial [Vicinamibacterales bacterium]|nr:carboxypeptidase-like regulatory domain-containing protein [Vicinamibacterales bacterium]